MDHAHEPDANDADADHIVGGKFFPCPRLSLMLEKTSNQFSGIICGCQFFWFHPYNCAQGNFARRRVERASSLALYCNRPNSEQEGDMKVGVLGSGDVAKTLAGGLVKHGHDVVLGTRDPAKLADWVAQHRPARAASFPDAAKFGELVVLAVKGTAAAEALRNAGAANVAGKPVIDANNPIADAPPVNGVVKFFTNLDESLMERLQREFAGARFVKAFNSVGHRLMVNPQFKGGKPTMFICGNDEAAKQTVRGILDQFGWETADMGKAEAARAIEPLCMLWCIPGFLRNQWSHAFKLLT
jgi:predicted dinucleotide-binding enzyme